MAAQIVFDIPGRNMGRAGKKLHTELIDYKARLRVKQLDPFQRMAEVDLEMSVALVTVTELAHQIAPTDGDRLSEAVKPIGEPAVDIHRQRIVTAGMQYTQIDGNGILLNVLKKLIGEYQARLPTMRRGRLPQHRGLLRDADRGHIPAMLADLGDLNCAA